MQSYTLNRKRGLLKRFCRHLRFKPRNKVLKLIDNSSSSNIENHNREKYVLISIDFDDFFSVFSLVFVSIEKI